MESFVENKNTNMFFTRGCKSIPRPYQDNSNIYCDSCSKLCNFDWLKNIKLPPKYYLLQNIYIFDIKKSSKKLILASIISLGFYFLYGFIFGTSIFISGPKNLMIIKSSLPLFFTVRGLMALS